MPCWEVRTMKVEFQAKNESLLIEVLNAMGLKYSKIKNTIRIHFANETVDINLEKQTVECLQTYDNVQLVNRLRVEYSKAAVMKAAKLRKWAVRIQGQNKFQLVRS